MEELKEAAETIVMLVAGCEAVYKVFRRFRKTIKKLRKFFRP